MIDPMVKQLHYNRTGYKDWSPPVMGWSIVLISVSLAVGGVCIFCETVGTVGGVYLR